MRISPGTRVWLYGKLPMGGVIGFGVVHSVHEHAPTQIWERFGVHSGVSREHFFDYFRGASCGCAIVFQRIVRLQRTLGLEELREQLGRFTPPQFFRRILRDSDELRLLETVIPQNDLASAVRTIPDHLSCGNGACAAGSGC